MASQDNAVRKRSPDRQHSELIRRTARELEYHQSKLGKLLSLFSEASNGEGTCGYPASDLDAALAARVRKIIRHRDRRREVFGDNLFSDPAWDLMLGIFHASLQQTRLPVGAACAEARAPATTALRWISTLEDKGLLIREADPFDGRRVYLSLSDEGYHLMWGLLQDLELGV